MKGFWVLAVEFNGFYPQLVTFEEGSAYQSRLRGSIHWCEESNSATLPFLLGGIPKRTESCTNDQWVTNTSIPHQTGTHTLMARHLLHLRLHALLSKPAVIQQEIQVVVQCHWRAVGLHSILVLLPHFFYDWHRSEHSSYCICSERNSQMDHNTNVIWMLANVFFEFLSSAILNILLIIALVHHPAGAVQWSDHSPSS